MSLNSKIKQAIAHAADDGAIIGNDSPEDWEVSFSIDGEKQFYSHLLILCTPAEKVELLIEWVLNDGDEQVCSEVCDYMMGKHNGLHSIAKEAAGRILEHYSSTVDEALGA